MLIVDRTILPIVSDFLFLKERLCLVPLEEEVTITRLKIRVQRLRHQEEVTYSLLRRGQNLIHVFEPSSPYFHFLGDGSLLYSS